MSNRVQVRPSSSNCIISMGKSHGITFKILGRVSVQESPRKVKKFKEDRSHRDLKTVKIGRNYPVHKFYSRYWENWEKNTHWTFQCSITLCFLHCICYSFYTFAEMLFAGYARKQQT